MTQVVFAGGGTGGASAGIDGKDVDSTGIVEGDPLIWNAVTNRFEPYSQAGNTAQAAFLALIGLQVGPPTAQVP